jgi:hypothetical protein
MDKFDILDSIIESIMSFSNSVFIKSIAAIPEITPPTNVYVIGPIPEDISIALFCVDGVTVIGEGLVVGAKAKFVRTSFPMFRHTLDVEHSTDDYGRAEVSYKITHYTSEELATYMTNEFAAFTNQEVPAEILPPWSAMEDDPLPEAPVPEASVPEAPERALVPQNNIREGLIEEIADYCNRAGTRVCMHGTKCRYVCCTYSHNPSVAIIVKKWERTAGHADRMRNIRVMSTTRLLETAYAIAIKEGTCPIEIHRLKQSLVETGSLSEFRNKECYCDEDDCDAIHVTLFN